MTTGRTDLDKLPLVACVEPVRGWWDQEPGFGQQFVGDLGELNVPQVLLEVEVPGPPRALGVQLYRSDRQILAEGNRDIWAEVNYGSGGVNNTFRCDWRSGCSFGLIAKKLTLSWIPHVPLAGLAATDTLHNIVIGATVGGAPLGMRGPTVYSPDASRLIAPLVSKQDAIPDFATGYILNAYDPTAVGPPDYANLTVAFRTANNNEIMAVSALAVLPQLLSPEGLSIPGVAQFVTVQNNTANSVRLQSQFALSI